MKNFELTAEEVEIVESCLTRRMKKLGKTPIDILSFEEMEEWFSLNTIIAKIKQWQDENRTDMESKIKLWIARDKDGDLLITDAKPKLFINGDGQPCDWWEAYDDYKLLHERLDMNESEEYKDLYPEITFENSPQQVELKLIDEDETT